MLLKIEAKLYNLCVILTILFPALYLFGNATADAALSIIACSFIARSAIKKEWQWCSENWVRFGMALYILLVLRSLFTEHLSDSLSRSLPFIRYIIFATALSNWLFVSDKVRKYTVFSILIFVPFICLNGIIQYFYGADLFGNIPLAHTGFVRLTNIMGKKLNVGTTICLISFPAILYCFDKIVTKDMVIWQRFLRILFITIILILILLSGERVAFVLCGLGMVLGVLLYKKLTSYILPAFLIFSLLIGTLFFFKKDILFRQYENTVHMIANLPQTAYGQVFLISFNLFKAHPSFGIGAKQYRHLCPDPKYHPYELSDAEIYHDCIGHPHNIYLELLTEAGMVGFFLFISMIYCWIRRIFPLIGRIRAEPILCGVFIALFIKLWPIASSGSLFIAWANGTIWFMAGWLLSYRNYKK